MDSLYFNVDRELSTAVRNGDVARAEVIRILHNAITEIARSQNKQPGELSNNDIVPRIRSVIAENKAKITELHDIGNPQAAQEQFKKTRILKEFFPVEITEQKINSLAINFIRDMNVEHTPDGMEEVINELIDKVGHIADHNHIRMAVQANMMGV